jgi:hypothetical protein
MKVNVMRICADGPGAAKDERRYLTEGPKKLSD